MFLFAFAVDMCAVVEFGSLKYLLESVSKQEDRPIIWFRNKEAGLVHLDRDDRGNINDTIDFDGKTIDNPLNQEIVTIRGVLPGEYIVNVHYYETVNQSPVPANVTISKVNPILNVAFYGETILHSKGDESTVARFTVNREGDIIAINKLQKNIVIF